MVLKLIVHRDPTDSEVMQDLVGDGLHVVAFSRCSCSPGGLGIFRQVGDGSVAATFRS